MKNFLRFLFTAAILLLALIIYNDRKNERDTRVQEDPDIEVLELQAEICFTQIESFPVPDTSGNSGLAFESLSDPFRDPAYLVRLKIQVQLHREIKPELSFNSGPLPPPHPPVEDPLMA